MKMGNSPGKTQPPESPFVKGDLNGITRMENELLMDDIKLQLQESIDTKKALLSANLDIIRKIADTVVNAFRNNHRIYLIGNGGSAADAQHIAGELIGRFKMNRR